MARGLLRLRKLILLFGALPLLIGLQLIERSLCCCGLRLEHSDLCFNSTRCCDKRLGCFFLGSARFGGLLQSLLCLLHCLLELLFGDFESRSMPVMLLLLLLSVHHGAEGLKLCLSDGFGALGFSLGFNFSDARSVLILQQLLESWHTVSLCESLLARSNLSLLGVCLRVVIVTAVQVSDHTCTRLAREKRLCFADYGKFRDKICKKQ